MAKAAKKAPAPVKKTPKKTPSKKVALMRDLHSITDSVEAKMQALVGMAGILKNLKAKTDEMSIKVEEAKKDYDERHGKVEKDIADFELEAVKAALQKYNKQVIDSFELNALRALESKAEQDKGKTKSEIDHEVAEKVAERVRFAEVEFAEKFAKKQAQEKAFEAERAILNQTIVSLRLEVESQKALSSDIAKANQQKKINDARAKAIRDLQAKEDAMREAQLQAAGVVVRKKADEDDKRKADEALPAKTAAATKRAKVEQPKK
eukprot:TRINITY_DN1168_c0_g1_i1.p1 TRINITY_DN1168_c0_g1~~TRINITY_DN1168_c0_g1_i1.p1  ORF type:complete len:264 (+),score=85.82 TRINITY_DN1168_c0_g1_i1:66-857(+)